MVGDAQDGKPSEPRLRALCDLRVAAARERAGWHGYDGVLQDLSPSGVRSSLARLGVGAARRDAHDEQHLAAAEAAERVWFGDLELYRRSPRIHMANLDLGVYERPYASTEERAEARRRHLRGWPDAVDAAVQSLDAVPALVAEALLPSARGLVAAVDPDEAPEAVAAHGRFVRHLEQAAATSEVPPGLGAAALGSLLGVPEALEVDLSALLRRAAEERRRLEAMLREACERLRPGRSTQEAVDALLEDHPDAEGVVTEARALAAEATGFVRGRGLLEDLGGECRVAPSPPSRRWGTASLIWAAPYEPDGPSWFYLTPPAPDWGRSRSRQWLQTFSRTTLPATTVHEVAPGHFTHGRALRRASSDVRRTLHSAAFIEGWAHYGEELCVEEGYRADDPRFAAGVALKALMRVVRLEAAVAIHTGALTVEEATARFEQDAHLRGPAALGEARRALHDPTYGRYTWGKLVLHDVREHAKRRWGSGFGLRRFHDALLDLGAPPLGLVGTALYGSGTQPGSHERGR